MDNSNIYSRILPTASVTRFPDAHVELVSSLGKKLFCAISMLCSDLIAILTGTALASIFSNHSLERMELIVLAVIGGLFVLTAASKGHYSRRIPFWDQAQDLIKLFAFFTIAHGAAIGMLPEVSSSSWYIGLWLTVFVAMIAFRYTAKELLLRSGAWRIPTVIIGDGSNAVETALALTGERHLGYDIVSFLSPTNRPKNTIEIRGKIIPVRHFEGRSSKILRRLGSPYVVIALERGGIDKLQSQIDRLILDYPNISVAPALRGLPLFGAHPIHFFSHEVMVLEIKNNLTKFTSRVLKRTFDLVVATLLLACLAPIFLIIGYMVRKTGKSIFFSHERIGQNGKPFQCHKFRSMVENSRDVLDELLANSDEARREWYRDFKLKEDPRITRIGCFLRKSSLDELPQLWNVIRGDMSLVGPRPVIKDEIPYYGNYVNFYYRSRPGLTGLWQVSGRNDIDYENRVQLDVWYVSNWSLWNDIVILLRTVTVVLSKTGAY